MPHPWLFSLILLVLAIAIGQGLWERYHRQRQLRELARRFNLNYSAMDLLNLSERYHNLSLLQRGHNRHICHILYGSHQAGLVALFRFSCELGLGLQRNQRQWWIAIVERDSDQPFWQAWPADTNYQRPHATSGLQTRLGDYLYVVDRPTSLDRLQQSQLPDILENGPSQCVWESRGGVVATACPCAFGDQDPAALLETVIAVARTLDKPSA